MKYAATPSGLVVRLESDGHQPDHAVLFFFFFFTVYMLIFANQSHLCMSGFLSLFFSCCLCSKQLALQPLQQLFNPLQHCLCVQLAE